MAIGQGTGMPSLIFGFKGHLAFRLRKLRSGFEFPLTSRALHRAKLSGPGEFGFYCGVKRYLSNRDIVRPTKPLQQRNFHPWDHFHEGSNTQTALGDWSVKEFIGCVMSKVQNSPDTDVLS